MEIRELWEQHWAGMKPSSATGLTNSRFTTEAFAAISQFIESGDTKILEVGCGTGRFCVLMGGAFPQAKVTGLDISESGLGIARKCALEAKVENVSFVAGDIFAIPFPNDSFDAVFCEGVIQHFPRSGPQTEQMAVREMLRVLRPGGKIVVSVVNWYCLPHTLYKALRQWGGKEYEYGYEKSYSARELRSLFRHFGLGHLELAGYYPSYGFYRLGWLVGRRFPGLGKVFDLAGKLIDRFAGRSVANRFGFEIVIKGVK